MKKIISLFSVIKYFAIVIAFITIYKITGCGWNDPCYRNLGTHTTNIIRVDQALLTRDTLNSNETQSVRLWDTIGTNSGYTFKGIQMTRSQNEIGLTLNNALDINCGATVKDTIMVMTGYIYNISPPFNHGTYIVTIHQPDGGVLNKSFYVR